MAEEVLGDQLLSDVELAVPELQQPAAVELLRIVAHPRIQPSCGANTNRVASCGNRSQLSTRSGRKRQTPPFA